MLIRRKRLSSTGNFSHLLASIKKSVVLCSVSLLFLPAGCTAAGNTPAKNEAPFQQIPHTYEASSKAELIFAQLKLDDALAGNNKDALLQACATMLDFAAKGSKVSPTSFLDASVWLLANEHETEAVELVEKASLVLADDLPLTALRADLFIQANERDKAIELLKTFAKKHPENPLALAELALALLRSGLADQAMKVFERIPSKDLTPQIRFSYAQSLKIQKRFSEAEKQLQAAVDDEPEYAEAWQLLALTKEEMGQKNEARRIYEQLLALDPGNRSARLFLIRLHLRSSRIEDAVKIITDSNDSMRFAVAAASILIEEKKLDKAENLLIRLEKNPHIPDDVYFYHAALLYEHGQDLNDALKMLDKVPTHSQEYEKALRMKVRIYCDQKELGKALSTAESILREHPEDLELILLCSELYMKQKNYDKADELLSEAVSRFPNDAHAQFQRAYLREYQGKRDEAMQMMEDVLQQHPQHALALNFIGYNLADSGEDLQRALTLIQKAVELEPEQDFILDSLAWVHYRLGNMQEAWKHIQNAVQISKDDKIDPTMLEHYGDIAIAVGKKSEARTAWQKAEKVFLELNQKNDAARVRAKREKF